MEQFKKLINSNFDRCRLTSLRKINNQRLSRYKLFANDFSTLRDSESILFHVVARIDINDVEVLCENVFCAIKKVVLLSIFVV
jgi:hypothetical protein